MPSVAPGRWRILNLGFRISPHFSRVFCYSAGSIRQCCVLRRVLRAGRVAARSSRRIKRGRAPRRTVKYASGALRARALL